MTSGTALADRLRCAIRSRISSLKWLPAAFAACALLVVIGCDEDDAKRYKLYFSHYTHMVDYETACSDCHGDAESGSFAKPSHASCVDCHEDWIETKKIAPGTCGECHKERNLEELAALEAPEPSVPVAGAFVHTPALTNRCDACHGNLIDEDLKNVPEIKFADRRRMRTEAHSWGMACVDCHTDMDPDIAPPNHDRNWERLHGEIGMQPDSVCSMCHSEQSCRECHQETMPQSHNNLWRMKTHGIEAAWDREKCMVCHEEDSCTACHQEVRPQSHNAAWEKTHCMQCHPSDATGTGCTFCHEGGLEAHPDPHPVNWESQHCRSCHNGTPQGDQCIVCHEDSGLDNHPNPHGAGWEQRHCNQCHGGDLNGVSCEACHGGDLLADHPNPHPANYERRHCTECHNGSVNGVSCEECHGGDLLEDHPNPHGPGWEQRHCNNCHTMINGVSCESCHGDDLLADHPNPHPPTFESTHCDSCHEGSTVNGISCEECHGGDLIGDHPNPHPGSYERTHCNSCHAGPAAEECEICHEGGSSVLVHEDFWPPVHDRFGDAANCSDCHY